MSAKKGRFLVCDDERNVVRFIQAGLEKAGHYVSTVFSGEDALDKLGKDTFDVLVLDVMLPGIDGFEVLRQVRTNPDLEHLFVVVTTTMAQDKDISDGYQFGAYMYLTKPFDPNQLARIVQDLR